MNTTQILVGLFFLIGGASPWLIWLLKETIQANRKTKQIQVKIEQKKDEMKRKDFIDLYESITKTHKSYWIGGNCYEVEAEKQEEYTELTNWLNDNFKTYWDYKSVTQ